MDQPNITPSPTPVTPPPEQGERRLTKHELRAARREERRAEQSAQEKRRMTKRLVLWSSLIVIVALVVWVMVALVRGNGPTVSGPVPGVNEVAADDHVFGKADSTVTLIEYGDYECPGCALTHTIVKKLADDYKDKIRVIFRNFPLPQHLDSLIAAKATEAAGNQGKFWEMNDKMYVGQGDWSEKSDSTARAIFAGYAKDIGINVDRFNQELGSSAIKAKIDKDQASGVKAGVDSTPTFFLNGSKIDARIYDDFKRLIDHALNP